MQRWLSNCGLRPRRRIPRQLNAFACLVRQPLSISRIADRPHEIRYFILLLRPEPSSRRHAAGVLDRTRCFSSNAQVGAQFSASSPCTSQAKSGGVQTS
jgi:hypothetical protein